MIDVLLYVLGILIVVVGLAVSIGLHEIGHLVPAKLFGVKVTQYMIGFGRTLWSRRKGETEYGVKMIPLGGYIAMTGMYPPGKPGDAARESTTGFLNTMVQEGDSGSVRAGAESSHERPEPAENDAVPGAETLLVEDERRAFYALPVWKKIIIMLGGPFMNLVLAFVLFAIVLVGFGLPQYTTTVAHVSECLIPASSAATTCSAEDPAAPGAAAGLRPGDTILAIDGARVTDWEQVRTAISLAPGTALDVEITRDGAPQTLTVTPAENQRAVTDANGRVLTNSDGTTKVETVGMIGVSPTSETVAQPITAVPAFVGENVASVAGVILHLPQRMVDVWNAAFGAEQRDPNGPMSVVGVGRMAGEIASLDTAPIAAKAQTMLGLLGSLNVALFVFNLVPLMPLDGGHVAGALYEGLKRGWARLRGKPDPGPIDTARMVPVTFVVVVILGAMSLLLMYADIVKPISLFG